MTESHVPGTASPAGVVTQREREPGRPVAAPPPTETATGRSGWTGGRITALVIGIVMVLVALGFKSAGAVALWADLSQRDSAIEGGDDFRLHIDSNVVRKPRLDEILEISFPL